MTVDQKLQSIPNHGGVGNDSKGANTSDYDLECALWADTPVSAWSDSIAGQVSGLRSCLEASDIILSRLLACTRLRLLPISISVYHILGAIRCDCEQSFESSNKRKLRLCR